MNSYEDQPEQKKIDDEGFETVGNKKKGKSQGRKTNGEKIQEIEVETEVSGSTRGRKADSNEDMTPMPKNKFKVLDIDRDDLEEHPLEIDLDSKDLVMTPAE
ncbi:hypothetical protein DPMN_069084 [Dreissena polymorpha]|uniref:Uncharacterized protein n=1 Tax=Dreissena polymorpha TaxID=45954 RepID=A0A9D3YYE8_DREPO|nr:hypothetical protein DPMN_069084 [Dreissena polymorpha]